MDLRPHHQMHRAFALVYAEMKDYAAAYTANQLFLEQGGDKIAPEQRQEAVDEMKKLARLVAIVTVRVDVPGSVVRVDDVSVGQAPLRKPVVLNVGAHRLVASHPEYPSQTKLVTAAAGSTQGVEFWLERMTESDSSVPSSPPASSSPPPSEGAEASAVAARGIFAEQGAAPAVDSKQGDSSDYLWLGWVATGALAAGATATGLLALSDDGSLADDRRAAATLGNVDSERLESDASRLRTLATVTDVLWIAAAAAAGATLWFTLNSDEPERVAESAHLRLQAGVSPEGVSLRARF
jgi:hypothetical protein